MYYKLKKLTIKKRGFSLLEMSIAVLVIGIIITAIAIGGQLTQSARLAGAKTLTKSSPVNRMTNLIMWYETTSDSSFIPSEVETTSINTWYNLNPSFNGNNAVAIVNPTYTENSINNLPALAFDGSSTYLQTYNVYNYFSLNNSFTIFVVFTITNPGSGTSTILSSSVTTSDRFVLNVSSNTIRSGLWNGSSYNTKSATYTSKDTGTIASITYNGSTIKLYMNGVVATGSSGPSSGSNTGFIIGRRTDDAYYLNGKVGEIIGFSKFVNDDDRREIEQYLSKKWKIPVS